MTLRNKSSSRNALILLAFIAFISLGLPDGLLGVAWPSLRNNFSRSLDSLGILLTASMAGYLFASFYAGYFLNRLGVGWLLSLSCGATGASLLGYTLVSEWWLMIPLSVTAGLGAGAIDAGINTYAAGHFSHKLMQWLHASFGIGITLGPLIMTFGINYFYSWRWGYVIVGTAQIGLAVCFALTSKIWQNDSHPVTEESKILTDYKTPVMETLLQYKVWLSILLFFIYAGIEASVGNWSYTLLTESRRIPAEAAGLWVGVYWGAFTLGRILAGFFTKHIRMHSLIIMSLIAAFSGAVLLLWNPVDAGSLAGLAIIGFAIAPIFPGMVSLTSNRVTPRFAANTVGMQISSAGLGMAVIPGLTGVLAQRTSLEIIPYLIILWIVLLFILYLAADKLAGQAIKKAL